MRFEPKSAFNETDRRFLIDIPCWFIRFTPFFDETLNSSLENNIFIYS